MIKYTDFVLGVLYRQSEDIEEPLDKEFFVMPVPGGTHDRGPYGLHYNCNDFFDYATADAEYIPEEDLVSVLLMNDEARHRDREKRRGRLCIKCRKEARDGTD